MHAPDRIRAPRRKIPEANPYCQYARSQILIRYVPALHNRTVPDNE